MQSTGSLRERLIAKTLRVPAADGASGDGAAVARQLDVALLSVGFKCSRELLEHLSGRHPAVVHDLGELVLRAVRAGRRPRPPQRLLHRLPEERP